MKKNKKYLILALILFLGIGFAYLTANLNINGQVSFTDSTFGVVFKNLEIVNQQADNATAKINDDNVSISISATFTKPGDYMDSTFYIANTGTIDALLNNIKITGLSEELSKYFTSSLTYDIGGEDVSKNDIITSGATRKVNLHVAYNYDINTPLETDETLNLNYDFEFINAKNNYGKTVWDYEYSGDEQIYYVKKSGNYKIEAWGAQGGNTPNYKGGYGAYTVGSIELNKGDKLYINIGGQPSYACNNLIEGGYNGGGSAKTTSNNDKAGAGGGATSVAFISGLLKNLASSQEEIITVAAGGGGAYDYDMYSSSGGAGGGITGNLAPWDGSCLGGRNQIDGRKASQTEGGGNSTCLTDTTFFNQYFGGFGYGGSILKDQNWYSDWYAGGGSGLYGGGASVTHGGNGGSSYIGNKNLTDKEMFCYSCESSNIVDTKTTSTNNYSENPQSKFAKLGNGYVRITYLEK